jgi:hypothetical protein
MNNRLIINSLATGTYSNRKFISIIHNKSFEDHIIANNVIQYLRDDKIDNYIINIIYQNNTKQILSHNRYHLTGINLKFYFNK